MEINKEFVENLIKQWINFRDNEFDRFKNMKCNEKLDFDSFNDKILSCVSGQDYKYVANECEKFYKHIVNFSSFYNEKYYQAGFADCLNLVIMSLGGTGINNSKCKKCETYTMYISHFLKILHQKFYIIFLDFIKYSLI